MVPTVITTPIVIFFIFCTIVAASGLGLIRRLPYLTSGLKLIGSIYVVRGLAFFGLSDYGGLILLRQISMKFSIALPRY